MHARTRSTIVATLTILIALTAVSASVAQDSAAQTERLQRKVAVGANGRVTVENISGRIQVTSGGGDEVTIEATKRTSGDRSALADVQVAIDSRPGRVDIRTEFPQLGFRNNNRNRVWVDYALTVPANASVDLHAVSGDISVTGVKGPLRAESVSGSISIENAARLEQAKSVSGSVSVSGVTEGDVELGTVSGRLSAMNLKVHGLSAATVSGSVSLGDVACERFRATSVSGSIEYAGSLAENGRYEVNTHSGSVRFQIPGSVGFDLEADTFSGSIRSDFAMTLGPTTIGGDGRDLRARGRDRSIRATFGDGKAELVLHTFSGSIAIQKR